MKTSRRPERLAFAGLLACAVALGGCSASRVFGRAVGAFFSSPREVPNKVQKPVRKDARLAVLWVGHATALVQIDDKIVLTDPVFTSTVGQFSRRLVEPGLDPANLPPVDAALISHVHLDHLSLGSIDMIDDRIRALFLPPGGATYLTDFGFPTYELRPWQSWEKDGLRVTAAPVDHVGFRYGADDAWMQESFTGYVVEYHGLKVYFGGDTAYDQHRFVETALRFPGIDLALLPIAPIEPRDFMRRLHMDPREALQAFVDLDATRMVPIHFDTFVTSTDEPGAALRELQAAQKKVGLPGGHEVVPLAIGEQRVLVKIGENPKPRVRTLPPLAPPTSTSKEEAPPPKETIPEDDRLD